eukprot:495511_1
MASPKHFGSGIKKSKLCTALFIIFHIWLMITTCDAKLYNWTYGKDLGVERHDHMCGYDNVTNSIMVYYGQTIGIPTNTIERYYIDTDTVSNAQSLSPDINTWFQTKTFVGAPYWYFLADNAFGQFHPSTNTATHPLSWNNNKTPTFVTDTLHDNEYSCVVIADNRYLIVLDGYFNSAHNKMQIYDTTNEVWSHGPAMTYRHDGGGCVIDDNNILYIISGNDNTPTNILETIDVSHINNLPNSWAIHPYSLSQSRLYFGCTLYENNIYVIGGVDMDSSAVVASVEIIDTNTGVITSGPDIPIPLAYFCTVVADHKIYVFGGEQENGGTHKKSVIISNSLSTSVPTNTPTTIVPTTVNPTLNPSSNPTTMFPTLNPTL